MDFLLSVWQWVCGFSRLEWIVIIGLVWVSWLLYLLLSQSIVAIQWLRYLQQTVAELGQAQKERR